MSRTRAVAGSVLFFLLAPGVVAVLLPALITGWDSGGDRFLAVQLLGIVLIVAGGLSIVESFVRFVVEGHGTPAPPAAPDHLVVRGQYRYVRNPMYVAVGSLILGQALFLFRPVLLLYLLAFMLAVFTFVRFHEEPALEQQFGTEYLEYKHAVPGWWPKPPARSG